jgi:hypothetical protein
MVVRPRSGVPLARSFFLAAVAYSLHWTFFFGGPRILTYAWAAVFVASSALMFPLVLRTLLIFSDEVRVAGREPHRRWPWLFTVFGPFTTSWVLGVPLSPAAGLRGIFAVNLAFGITFLVLLIRAFRNAGAVGRRQLKWVLYGVAVGTVPVLATDVVAALAPSLWWLHEIAVAAEAVIPICIVIAIVRYHLFDIDRLISATAVYSVLTVILGGGVLTVVPPLAEAASGAFAIDAGASRLVLSFALAACLLPAQRRLRPVAERLFLPDRHRLEQGFQHLLCDLSGCATPEAALTLAGERLDTLLVPEACRAYAATAEGYVLVYPPERRRLAAAAAGAPAAEGSPRAGEPPLAAPRLDARRVPAEPVHIGRDAAIGPSVLPPRTRALLESLGIAVVAHVTRGGERAGLLCLGPKRSGDVYTPGDLALLAALADKLSSEFRRLEQAESLRQERSMQEALRRYVPDPVASLLATGRDLDGGEREVSVLFVDLRSFTTYSETHAIDTVLAIVNRYTETASGIIRRHRGTVLEFLGDGMMAVFGAPELVLPRHAARRVHLRRIGVPGARPQDRPRRRRGAGGVLERRLVRLRGAGAPAARHGVAARDRKPPPPDPGGVDRYLRRHRSPRTGAGSDTARHPCGRRGPGAPLERRHRVSAVGRRGRLACGGDRGRALARMPPGTETPRAIVGPTRGHRPAGVPGGSRGAGRDVADPNRGDQKSDASTSSETRTGAAPLGLTTTSLYLPPVQPLAPAAPTTR